MPATDPRFPRAPSAADDWFHYPDVTPLAGRLAPAGELDEAAADALVNAIAALSDRRGRAAAALAAAAPAPPIRRRLPDRAESGLRRGAGANPALSPIRTVGGWRNA